MEFVLRMLLGFVFLWSSLPKLSDPYAFLVVVEDYELLESRMALYIAATLPLVELVVAGSLLGGVLVPAISVVGAALALSFSIAQVIAIAKGLNIVCGCFGGGANSQSELIGPFTLGRAMLVFIGLASVFYLSRIGQGNRCKSTCTDEEREDGGGPTAST